MPVAIVIRETGEEVTGKCTSIDAKNACLLWGIISDKKGCFRGDGKKAVAAAAVTVAADDPSKELMTASW